MHELEVQGIADGDVATGVKGFDPVANNQLEQSEITAAEADPLHKLKLKFNAAAQGEEKTPRPTLHAALQTPRQTSVNPVVGEIPPRIIRWANW